MYTYIIWDIPSCWYPSFHVRIPWSAGHAGLPREGSRCVGIEHGLRVRGSWIGEADKLPISGEGWFYWGVGLVLLHVSFHTWSAPFVISGGEPPPPAIRSNFITFSKEGPQIVVGDICSIRSFFSPANKLNRFSDERAIQGARPFACKPKSNSACERPLPSWRKPEGLLAEAAAQREKTRQLQMPLMSFVASPFSRLFYVRAQTRGISEKLLLSRGKSAVSTPQTLGHKEKFSLLVLSRK